VKIRRIIPDERVTTSLPLQVYAFSRSPMPAADYDKLTDYTPYMAGNLILVAEEDGETVATAGSIPMRQNVRGTIHRMAGIAGVATHPLARRRGHIRTLLLDLLGQVRESGHTVSALYPFRPSFYARFGYVGLPKTRTVSFAPADLRPLLSAELPGRLGWERIRSGYDAFRAFEERLLAERHGFGLFPANRAQRLRDDDERWLVTARVDGQVVGAVTYRIAEHGADLLADHLLSTSALGRALLLSFFARHVDQVARIVVTVAPDELPELWGTDVAAVTEARTSFPTDAAPMVRLLSVDALAGTRVGPGRVAVEVVDDPFVAGRYVFDGDSGALEVDRGAAPATTPVATLTVGGLSALVYGVLDPEEVVLRGFGTVAADAATQLRSLWPREVPYLTADF
jgi:predicted N-acetyltransferase YhbS